MLTNCQSPDEDPIKNVPFVEDKQRARKLVRRMDLHILPLCAWVYLLNYLDRGNIGNSKVLNQETGDSLLQATNMTNTNYAVAVSLFSLAYALFEVPSNWIMKRYVRPSVWLATLLGAWGVFTVGFAGVQNYATVVVLRFFIGVFEAVSMFVPTLQYVETDNIRRASFQVLFTSSPSGILLKSVACELLSCSHQQPLREPSADA